MQNAGSAETAADINNYAGFWKRLLAGIIDLVIVSVVSFTFSIIGHFSGKPGIMVAQLLTLGLACFYFPLFECSQFQATPGKLALGIIVTDTDGHRVGFARAFARNLGKSLSNIILWFGYFMIGWTKRKQGLHDMIANCLVLNKSA